MEDHIANTGISTTRPTLLRAHYEEMSVIGPSEIRHRFDGLDSGTRALGAEVVAHAWADPEFRARLLSNGREACEELGIRFYKDSVHVLLLLP